MTAVTVSVSSGPRGLRGVRGEQGEQGLSGGEEALQLKAELESAEGTTKIGTKAHAQAEPQELDTRLRQFEFLQAASFGVTAGTQESQSDNLAKAYAAAVEQKKGLLLPQGPIAYDATIPLYGKMPLIAHGHGLTNFIHLPGSTAPIFDLRPGPQTFGCMRDIGFMGNGEQDERCLAFIAKPANDQYANGGLWSYTIDRLRMEGYGGISLQSWGGVDSKLPNQFLTFSNLTIYRGTAVGARSVSLAGQNGQVVFTGSNEFTGLEKEGDANRPVSPGVSVVISRLYRHIASGVLGDATAAQNEVGATLEGWEAVPSQTGNNEAYAVHFTGGVTTFQSAHRGILLEGVRTAALDNCYFENVKQAVTAIRSTVRVSAIFNNAGALPTSDGSGYIIGGDENSRVHLASPSEINGRHDQITRALAGNFSPHIDPMVRLPNNPGPANVVRQLAPVNGALTLPNGLVFEVGSGQGEESITSIIGNHPPGTSVIITCAANSILNFENNFDPWRGGDAVLKLRWKDSVVLMRSDLGGYKYFVVGGRQA